jgi:hypothetical protein
MSGRCVQGTATDLLGDGAERCSARSARYVVREIEGYNVEAVGSPRQGLSVHVLDRLRCHRIMRTWRSEDYSSTAFPGRAAKDVYMRAEGCRVAAELNAGHDAAL